MRKQYSMVDILKFISAIMIVAIHTQPFLGHQDSIFYYPYAYLKCFAIPFFFVSSSFLFFSKFFSTGERNKQISYYKKWIKRIGGLYFVYSVINVGIYIPFSGGGTSLSPKNSMINVLSFVFLGKNNGYLWFVAALIISISVISFVCLIKNNDILKVLITALFVVSSFLMMVLQFYYKFFENCDFVKYYYLYFDNVRNFISGLFYVLLGLIVVCINKSVKLKRILSILTPLVFVCSCVEYYYIVTNNIYKEEFSTLLISIFVAFIMLISVNLSFDFKYSSLLRKISNVMYFQQRYIILLTSALLEFGFKAFENNVFCFFVVTGMAIILTLIYEQLRKTKLKKIIKYLY